MPSIILKVTMARASVPNRASDARMILVEHLQTHAQLRTGGVRPIDDGSALKPPPPEKSVVLRFIL